MKFDSKRNSFHAKIGKKKFFKNFSKYFVAMNCKTRKREASPEMSEADRAKQISDRYRQLLREVQLNPERIDTDPDFQDHLLV
jgi:hypothetical protein